MGQTRRPRSRACPSGSTPEKRRQDLDDRPAAVLHRRRGPSAVSMLKSLKSACANAVSNVPSPRSTVVRVVVVGSSVGGHDGITRMLSRSDRTRTVVRVGSAVRREAEPVEQGSRVHALDVVAPGNVLEPRPGAGQVAAGVAGQRVEGDARGHLDDPGLGAVREPPGGRAATPRSRCCRRGCSTSCGAEPSRPARRGPRPRTSSGTGSS